MCQNMENSTHYMIIKDHQQNWQFYSNDQFGSGLNQTAYTVGSNDSKYLISKQKVTINGTTEFIVLISFLNGDRVRENQISEGCYFLPNIPTANHLNESEPVIDFYSTSTGKETKHCHEGPTILPLIDWSNKTASVDDFDGENLSISIQKTNSSNPGSTQQNLTIVHGHPYSIFVDNSSKQVYFHLQNPIPNQDEKEISLYDESENFFYSTTLTPSKKYLWGFGHSKFYVYRLDPIDNFTIYHQNFNSRNFLKI